MKEPPLGWLFHLTYPQFKYRVILLSIVQETHMSDLRDIHNPTPEFKNQKSNKLLLLALFLAAVACGGLALLYDVKSWPL